MSETESLSELPLNKSNTTKSVSSEIPIEIEIVSEEEMALLEAALAFASVPANASAICSPLRGFHGKARSIQSITVVSKRTFSGHTEPDIEDSGNFATTQKKNKNNESFLHRFRKNKGLSVTDITSTEWCEKQMEFVLLHAKRRTNKAMKTGSARHAKLEEEVVKKVKVQVKSKEDTWALKFLNFIIGANQLLFEGLTRELPIIGFAEGVWMVGVIDEIRIPATETDRNPILVDTKTRVRDTLPAEPQRRNGRLQLMCYKYIWDNLVADNFPSQKFFDFFTLNPYSVLSEELRERTADSGFPADTLDDIVRLYRNTCSILPPAHDQLLLRYEFQKDNSLLGEDHFAFDSDWLKNQIHGCLEFWLGEREACYTPEEERWKCRFCQFASICPTNNGLDSTPSPTNTGPDSTPHKHELE
ncbi:exonuclease V, chloroplastic isoform X1 [Quercus suber]|uniref:Exonuclease v n=1 Tax=Quercus suber TaxID=58331 RepID=A0AAW0LVK0_QUESU|nr:exonuclease V, chloroplastic-like [Quercus suber]